MGDPSSEELSPDGRTLVRWAVSDGRMSHVIRTPTIVDAASGRAILSFADSGYDAAIAWGEAGRFEIDLRHYWRPGALRVAVDRNTGSFRPIRPGEEAPARPIETLSAFVGAHFSDGSGPAATAIRRNGLRPLWLPLALAAGLVLWALLHRG
jgi:hypothetical protein